ncbi:MAG TPA: thioredoxin family protein [Treponema sp.]|nr:thioredoxin family protein [Treponema sp.]HON14495.1 thioredoxin family protein [Treponema sp.]HPC72175.1 thioredoxin family protein [Treponema sp.]HRS04822.1 thioredoxin family protein [Treponema sp.]HRU29308.1 thioredoxin family protein [Treponema sp.]
MQSISSLDEFHHIISQEPAVLFYCSTATCGVCTSIKPKIIKLMNEEFPKMKLFYIDIEALPELRGQLSVYSVPAILGFFNGKELIREARNFGIMELAGKIDRYYGMLFE